MMRLKYSRLKGDKNFTNAYRDRSYREVLNTIHELMATKTIILIYDIEYRILGILGWKHKEENTVHVECLIADSLQVSRALVAKAKTLVSPDSVITARRHGKNKIWPVEKILEKLT